MQEIRIERTKSPRQKPADSTKLGFGQIFTDHMFIMNYDEGQGWHDPRIVPYGPLELDPAAMCPVSYTHLDVYKRQVKVPTGGDAVPDR